MFFFIVVVPNAPPDNVRGNNETSTSIFVQWDEVPADNQNGIIVNYTVTYTELPDGSPTDEVVVIAPKRNATLTTLIKFTNYSITVSLQMKIVSTILGCSLIHFFFVL